MFDESIRNESVLKWDESGKKIFGTVCCHVPEEIMHAAGILPVRMRGTGSKTDVDGELWLSRFSCGYAKATLQCLLDGTYDYLDGIVASDGCMFASRIYENYKMINKDIFRHEIVAPRQLTDRGIGLYKSQLEHFKAAIEEVSGNTITEEKLKASIELYNETRTLIQELYALRKSENPVISGYESLKITLAAMTMPKEEFNEKLKAFLEEAKKREPIKNPGARILLAGSPIDDPEYIKILEDSGAIVVTDVLCFGSRYLWEKVELENASDAMEAIARSYLGRPVCPRMMNLHDNMSDLIREMIKEYKVDGIIFTRLHNCTVWGGEKMYVDDVAKETDVPLLLLDRDEITSNAGQVTVRVEAFVEMLEERSL